jgi:hypothetical protein
VRLIAASGVRYAEGERFLSSVRTELEAKARAREARASSFRQTARQATTKTIDDFRADPRYGGDNTRIDLAFAIYALSHGAARGDVAASMRSRDLSHKGNEKRQGEYVERTMQKASKVVRSLLLHR